MCSNRYGTNHSIAKPRPRHHTYTSTKQTKFKSRGELVKGSVNVTLPAYIWAPLEVLIFKRYRHFMTVILAYQSYPKVYLLKWRKDILTHCDDFKAWMKRNAVMRGRRLHSDNAPENLLLVLGLSKIVVTATTSCVYTTQSNDLGEWMNRTLL